MIKKIVVLAPVKLNLNLIVLNKDLDGYHFLKTHICFLNFCDKIYLSKDNENSINQLNKKSKFKLRKDTLLLKSFKLFTERYGIINHFKIDFTKNIPIGAGLGGGSAAAGALLLGLRFWYNNNYSIMYYMYVGKRRIR